MGHPLLRDTEGSALERRCWLDAPVAVLGSRNWITPAAEMEELFFPQKEVHERVLPLPDHLTSTVQTDAELERRARLGV